MEQVKENKMGVKPIAKLIWQMGLPMIISMVLQAIYNVVDSIFVINMSDYGYEGGLSLTYAFPIQLLIIAIGVGTGVGINAMLSKSLAEKNKECVDKTVGNGIFLGICFFIIFLLFGLIASNWFISMQASAITDLNVNVDVVISGGTKYLQICSCFSIGAIGYAIYERFLQSTGKTLYSTISQISGAVANIVLDYIFIYPCGMGIEGAAWATVIGQILSLIIAMIFHYTTNKEIGNNVKNILPKWNVIKGIYHIGLSAAIMQGLLAVMMFGMTMILGTASVNTALLQNSYGIYYKIMQLALFAAFGISNTIISILSFNYGMKNKQRVKSCIAWGIVASIIVSLIITILFEAIANSLAYLFGMSALDGGSEVQSVVTTAIRISSISYVFMAISVAIQGVLQALKYALRPLLISLLRLVVFVLPIAYLFTLSENAINIVWWTFPIVEVLTAGISLLLLKSAYKKDIIPMEDGIIIPNNNLIITISREHGSNGKYIGKLLAQKLKIKYYDKEIMYETAQKTGLAEEYLKNVSENVTSFASLYLSTETNQQAIIAQAEVIKSIANESDCVIVGRGADYILRNYPNLIKIFIYANEDYKIATIMKLYKDDKHSAKQNILKSDKARSVYYNYISNRTWGDKSNYDLCIDSSIGPEKTAMTIAKFVERRIRPSTLKRDIQKEELVLNEDKQ